MKLTCIICNINKTLNIIYFIQYGFHYFQLHSLHDFRKLITMNTTHNHNVLGHLGPLLFDESIDVELGGLCGMLKYVPYGLWGSEGQKSAK